MIKNNFSYNRISRALLYSTVTGVFIPFACLDNTGGSNEAKSPNILFILTDDLGYGDVGCYGQTIIPTPRFDRLAEEGVMFTNAYAGAPVSGPSRSVLMTGQHTGHTTVRGNTTDVGGIEGPGNRRRMHLTEEDVTVANVLSDAGYNTALVGKWHLDGYNPEAGPLDRGFNEFYGWLISEWTTYNPSNYFPEKRFHNRELYAIEENKDGNQGIHHATMCINETIEFLNNNQNNPFFLYLAFNLPHNGFMAAPIGYDPFADEDWPDHIKLYGAMVSYMDYAIGEVLDHLDKLGLADNTIVFLASDNGPRSNYSEHLHEMVEFFNSNGPLRGYKRDMYEGGIRIPMIVRWPQRIEAGTVSDLPWYFADFLPTAADIASVESPDNIDGLSILPTLLGEEQNLDNRFLYWEFYERGFKQAVRWQNFKAVRYGLNGPLELYDLNSDIGETNDIAEYNEEVIKTIEQYLESCRTNSPYWIAE